MAPVTVFDVDGVLVDTRAIVRQAYARVGVRLPERLWGSAWRTWLPEQCGGDADRARRLHDRKTRVHLDLLAAGTVGTLPGARAARHLAARGWTIRFLTSSTRQVAERTLRAVDPAWGGLLAGTDLDHHGKRRALCELAPRGGVYVDDNRELGISITEDSEWHLVHFDGQSTEQLVKEIEASWTP